MVRKVTASVGRWLSAAGTAILIFMMLYIVASVFRRAIAGQPILGDVEITAILLPVAAPLFYIYTDVQKKHIRSTLLFQRFSPRWQTFLDSLFSFTGSGLYGVVSWRVFVYAMESVKSGAITDVLRLPTPPFEFVSASVIGLFSLYLFVEGVVLATEIREPKQAVARGSH